MRADYIHIHNAYVAANRKNRYDSTHTLVIETDLALPEKGHLSADPQMDTLLTEIHDMKLRYPSLFDAVDNVEIREKSDRVPTDDFIAFVSMAPAPFSHMAGA